MAILTLLYRMFTVPLFGLLSFLVTLTTPIWLPFKLVLLPLLYLASAVYDARTLPATIFAKVEILYVFLSSAAMIGILTGLCLYICLIFLTGLLNLNGSSFPEKLPVRTVASYRAARKKKQQQGVSHPISTLPASSKGIQHDHYPLPKDVAGYTSSRSQLLKQPILEEDSSES